jgi:hypothetical protein
VVAKAVHEQYLAAWLSHGSCTANPLSFLIIMLSQMWYASVPENDQSLMHVMYSLASVLLLPSLGYSWYTAESIFVYWYGRGTLPTPPDHYSAFCSIHKQQSINNYDQIST